MCKQIYKQLHIEMFPKVFFHLLFVFYGTIRLKDLGKKFFYQKNPKTVNFLLQTRTSHLKSQTANFIQ